MRKKKKKNMIKVSISGWYACLIPEKQGLKQNKQKLNENNTETQQKYFKI